MQVINPISTDQQSLVINTTNRYIELAGKLYHRQFQMIDVNFNLSGRAAGMYHFQAGYRYIRYNPYIFAKYFDDNLSNTVPHEVAHYIADKVYGIKNIKPHGVEWKTIMEQFEVKPMVRSNYDLDGIPQRQHKKFQYQCSCRNYEITTRRHNMIMRGERRYQCPKCNSILSSVQI